MCVVHLEGGLLVEFTDIAVFLFIFLNGSLNAGRYKEILLFQAQFLAGVMIVIGVQDFHDVPGQILLLHRLLVIPLVKGIQLEVIDRLRVPDPQSIYHIVIVTYDRNIKGNCQHGLIPFLDKAVASRTLVVFHPHIAAKLYLFRVLRTAQLKGIAIV